MNAFVGHRHHGLLCRVCKKSRARRPEPCASHGDSRASEPGGRQGTRLSLPKAQLVDPGPRRVENGDAWLP